MKYIKSMIGGTPNIIHTTPCKEGSISYDQKLSDLKWIEIAIHSLTLFLPTWLY